MYSRYVLVSVTLMASACMVHHHHYGEGAARDESSAGEAAADAVSADDFRQSEANETEYDHHHHHGQAAGREGSVGGGGPESPSSTASTLPDDFLPGCRTEVYPSGWILASCRDMEIFMITGPASRRSDEILASLTIDQVGRQVAGGLNAGIGVSISPECTVTLAGNSLDARRITVKPREETAIEFLAPTRKRPSYHGSGLFTVARADVGRIALVCHQEGSFDEMRCLETLESVLRRGLSDVAPSPDNIVTIASVPMTFSESCHYNGPTMLLCQLNGSLRWSKGSPGEARLQMQRLLDLHGDHEDIPGHHNPHEVFACTIGGHPAECHEIALQGVLASPNNIVYAALVDTPDGSYQFSCQVQIDDEMNEPCRLLFDGAHSGRWH